MEEKLIKLTARLSDGSQRKFRTNHFEIKPSRDNLRLHVKIQGHGTINCIGLKVEQKEITPNSVVVNQIES